MRVCVCVGGGGGGGGINLQGLETHIMFVSNATTNFHHGCNIHDVWTRKLVIVFHNCCLKGNNGPHGNTTKKSILKKAEQIEMEECPQDLVVARQLRGLGHVVRKIRELQVFDRHSWIAASVSPVPLE